MDGLHDLALLKVHFLHDTKIVQVEFLTDFYNQELLDDLSAVFSYLMQNVKIPFVHFNGSIPTRLDPRLLQLELLEKHNFYIKLQKLFIGIRFLPQTTLCNWNKNAQGMAIDFGLCCDFTCIHDEGKIEFNHLNLGIGLCYFTTNILTHSVGHHLCKKWILGSQTLKANQLIQNELCLFSYTIDTLLSLIVNLYNQINSQDLLLRIQTKKIFLEDFLQNFALKKNEMNKIALASIAPTTSQEKKMPDILFS